MVDYTETVRKVFMGTRFQDYLIQWGSRAWKKRVEEAPEAVSDVLAALGLYWKFARNTAIAPWTALSMAGGVLQGSLHDHQLANHKKQQLWKSLLNNSEQQLFLMGSQTLAYSGFYFGYEHFLTECCAIRNGTDASDLMGYSAIKNALISAFDLAVETEVWSGTDIEIARRARNALVHNGGLPDKELQKKAPPELLVDGYVCIHPIVVKELHDTLLDKVDVILKNW